MLRVGEDIHFFTGSVDRPPGLTVGQSKFFKNDSNVSQNLQGQAPKESLYPGAPNLPETSNNVQPVLKALPGTFRNFNESDAIEYNEKGISFDIRPAIQVNPLFVAHLFLYQGESANYPRIGELLEAEDGNSIVGLNEKVYIESKENFQVGEKLTLMGQDYVFDRNGIDGSVIRYMAKIKVEKKMSNNRYLCDVYRSLSGLKPGAWVTKESIPSFEDDHSGRPGDQKLFVIGGGEDNVSRIYGQGDVVFLKGGSSKGIRVGDILGIYKSRKLRYRDAKIDISPTPIAHVKVFRAEPNLTSAFVISSSEAIIPGDQTGAPTIFKNLSKSLSKDNLESLETRLEQGEITKVQ